MFMKIEDKIYNVIAEIRLLIYKIKVIFLKSHFFKWTHVLKHVFNICLKNSLHLFQCSP